MNSRESRQNKVNTHVETEVGGFTLEDVYTNLEVLGINKVVVVDVLDWRRETTKRERRVSGGSR